MSKIYERFLQNKHGAFTPQPEFERDLARYNIESGTIAKPSTGKVLNNTQLGGVPLSFNGNVVFADPSDSHTLIMGSTGSKKSRLIAMPTINILASSNESMIITDPKGELYAHSCAMLMKKGYSIFCFNLRNPATGDCWNPLIEPYKYYCDGNISKSCEMINDISLTISTAVKNEKDPYWHTSASSLFFGLTIHLFRYCKERNLPNHVNIRNVIELRTVLFRNEKIDNRVLKIICEDSIVRNALSNCIFNADNTRKNILSLFDEIIRIFSLHPDLADALSRNNIHWDDVYEKPTACFIIMPDEKTTYHGVASLFVKQSYEMLIDIYHKKTEGSHRQRINYILDEFSSLPTIADFPAMISAARSRNIRFNIIVQSKHQLDGKYGEEAETIQDNCVNWIFLVSRELKLLETLSVLCGTYYLDNSSRHHIRIEELQRLDKNRGEALVLRGRNRPYIAALPDIDKYPNKFGTVLTPDKRQVEEYSILSFEEYTNFPPDKFQGASSRSDNGVTTIEQIFKGAVKTEPKIESSLEGTKEIVDFFETPEMNIPEGKSNDLFEGIFSTQTAVIAPVKDSNSSPGRFEPEPAMPNKDCTTDDDAQRYAGKRLDDFFKSKIHTLLVGNEKIAISFPAYKLDGGLYEIFLVKENQGFYLSDEGTTLFELDKIFELSEPDVIKNLSAVLRQCGCGKKGQSITIDCTPDDVHIKLSYLIQCLSFMLNMKIFYV